MDEWLELILLCYVGVQTSSRYIELTITGIISFGNIEKCFEQELYGFEGRVFIGRYRFFPESGRVKGIVRFFNVYI